MKYTILLACLSLLFSCGDRREAGPPVSMTKKASTAKAEMLQAEINMAAGELSIDGGGKGEVSAELRYSSGGLVPNFRYDDTSFRGRLVVDQPKNQSTNLQFEEDKWRIQLPDGLATDIDVNMGAGEARLKLGSLDLRKVGLKMGAGKVVADFVGEPKRDYEIKIQGGVGECEVTLPKSAGIHAEATGGLGSIDVDGLEKKGSYYENAAFSQAGPKIRLSVQGGVGSIKILVR